jgi:peptidoglycan/LPS O-acetylase OafA/YrhL
MEAVNTKNRINYISGMKAFMLLIIFLIHAGVRGNQISQRACDFLFVISGYLIAYKHLYASEDIRVFSYIKNKIVTICAIVLYFLRYGKFISFVCLMMLRIVDFLMNS